MRIRLNNGRRSSSRTRSADLQSSRLRRRLASRLGLGAFIFFTLKGLVWLAVGGLALASAAKGPAA